MAIITTLVNHNLFRFLATFFALAFVASEVHVANARPCIIFDATFNLYAFGFGEKDFKLGTQENWNSTVNPTDVTSAGRPPFDGPQTTCYLAQFFDSIYVLNGDKSNPSAVHIFDAQTNTWSTQEVSTGGPDPTTLVAILDHDTNVFYALAGGTLSSLDLGTQTRATNAALSWNTVGSPPFDTTNYNPTMGIAQNHIYFIGVPNSISDTAQIFVIHFSFFQPSPQNYPVQGSGNGFPSTHGQAPSFFQMTGVQQELAFVPDDGSATYIIDVENNSTLVLAGPIDKSESIFAASLKAVVQLTSTGSLAFLPYTPGNNAANIAATWSTIKVQGLPAVSPGNSTTNSTASVTSGTASRTATAPGTGSTGAPSGTNEGLSLKVRSGVVILTGVTVSVVLAIVLVLL